jgi:hypothetical protein
MPDAIASLEIGLRRRLGQEEQGMKALPVIALVFSLIGIATRWHLALAQTASGSTVTYPAGLSLVAAPPGSGLTAVEGQLSTFQSGDREYQQSAPGMGTTVGYGYWAQFDAPATVQLAAGSNVPYTVNTLAGQWILIGDPSGSLPATVSGASALYTYEFESGYKTATMLQPGQGAWAQASGQMISVKPQSPDAIAAAAKLHAAAVNGVSVGIPGDWDRVTVKPADQSAKAEWASSDGNASLVIIGPEQLPYGARINAARGLGDIISAPKFLGTEQVSQPAAAMAVPGADAAATAGLIGSDPKFGSFQETLLLALVGQKAYVLDLTATTAFASQYQVLLDQIVQSFQVT